MTCNEFEELSGAYALDAITPEERREADAHLAECSRCSLLLQELRSVVALLPLAVTQIEPPVSLERRVLSAIQQESGTSIPQANGKLVYIPQQHLTVLIMRDLPQLQGSHVYQGWLLQGKQPRSIGLLTVQNGIASVDFPGDVQGHDAAAISLEPGPAASPDVPKGQVIAVGPLKTATIERINITTLYIGK